MRWLKCCAVVCAVMVVVKSVGCAQGETSPNLRQYVSAKVGFYSPATGLNNGLLFGLDGITEFLRHDFILSGAVDLYFKRTFDMFTATKPNVLDQSMVIIPLHVNVGYQVLNVPSADTRVYAGVGGGYYLSFYNLDHRVYSGGLLSSYEDRSASKNGGAAFGTMFARLLIGKVFLEPRVYLASKEEGMLDGMRYEFDPSGFVITIGFQYH